ncbi:hypothetical protein DCC79_12660 [bacterium]|nr:hypothetical protein [Chloroflexi bacterium CFX6]RIL08864.1 MAG: hypothetical protein DCC79_12660 [bacterium]
MALDSGVADLSVVDIEVLRVGDDDNFVSVEWDTVSTTASDQASRHFSDEHAHQHAHRHTTTHRREPVRAGARLAFARGGPGGALLFASARRPGAEAP